MPDRRLADPPSGTLPASGRHLGGAGCCSPPAAPAYCSPADTSRLLPSAVRDVKAAAPVAVQAATPASLEGRPHLLFCSTALDSTYGKVALVPLSRPDGPRAAGLDCERVYMAAGRCVSLLTVGSSPPTARSCLGRTSSPPPPADHRATEPRLAVARRAPGGHDGVRQRPLLRRWRILYQDQHLRRGQRPAAAGRSRAAHPAARWQTMAPARFNFWGVTFAAAVTASTPPWPPGSIHLIEGSLRARRCPHPRRQRRCPSLSPDGTRLAYKRRMPGRPVTWRLHVLNLSTMNDNPLAETRSVDDQVEEWLDDRHLLYSLEQGDRSSALAGSAPSPTRGWCRPPAAGRRDPHPCSLLARGAAGLNPPAHLNLTGPCR